ncbi:MAG: hypothetical protein PHC28_09175, partial [Flavobacterium sp.]|uniref:hypothetical protein n=1 Tax=Flavobacterium sp. TaxID=239 RepID=UPI002619893A
MKIKIAFLVLVTTLFSCKNDRLTDSYIYFNEPQPIDVEDATSFSNKYVGTFGRDYSHRLKIESKYVIKIEVNSFDATKKQMDSLPDVEFRNNIVYDKTTQKAYKTFVKNDTIQWETEELDTLFSFSANETSKIYKSTLILNKEIDGNYLVNIIKFNFSNNKYIQLGTRKDFVKITDQLKIPFDVNVENNDTIFVVLKPSRADFRK